jgi:hypothetical protein
MRVRDAGDGNDLLKHPREGIEVPLEKGRCKGPWWHIEVPLGGRKRRFPDGPKVEPHRGCKPQSGMPAPGSTWSGVPGS